MTNGRFHRRRRILILAVLLFLVVLAAAAAFFLLSQRANPVTVPPGAAAGEIFLEPCAVKTGGIEYSADCGTLVVPEYRGDPASRLIALPVRRIHSPAASPAAPIFFLEGGPGTSNMGKQFEPWLLENHDVVQVGYRGVDGTPKLDCPDFGRATHGIGSDLLSPESLESIGEAPAACAETLQEEGIDLRGYMIPEVVEDLDAARIGLGYDRINLLSESYGTRVAQIYAQIRPQSLLRSAMIGVNPPGHFLWLPETVDAQIGYYADLCRKDSACSARTPDLAESIRRVNRSMPANWMGIRIDPGKVRMLAFVLLYHRSTAPVVFDAYLAAENGDPRGLALMSTAYDLIMPHMMTWGEFLALGASADYEPGRDYLGELTGADNILGAPFSEFIWGTAPGHWPPILMDEAYRRAVPTDVETLLVSGSVDFSTPAQFATQDLLPGLRNGRQVILAEQGHTEDFWQFLPAAAQRLLTSFFDTGEADDSLYAYLTMDFQPAVRFPVLAKILLAAVVLLIVVLELAIWWIVRRIRTSRRTQAGSAG
jgi:pimeloyl-ACP methyl ester carboxylesterase